MSRAIFCGGILGCSLVSTIAGAHPGHGTSHGQSAEHYLVEPRHLLPWLAGLALVVVLCRVPRWRRHWAADRNA